MDNDIAIRVEHVSKTFKLPHEKSMSIKNRVVNFWRRDKGYESQQALNDVSFEVRKGEFFGIVGRNGSGKSTLLKLLSGIYTPTRGAIQVNGKLTPFIELGVGFNPELSGRENVYLNGALLGFNRKEMAAMYNDIVDFAELKRFMDQKLKNYSSGMQVRLAFSIAIRANTDILVLDEVLAVGDEAFQRKCSDFFKKIKQDKTKTVVLVTHDMDSVRKYCSGAILIDDGRIKVSGSPEDVANEYSLENTISRNDEKADKTKTSDVQDIKAELLSAKIVNEKSLVEIQVSYRTTLSSTRIVLNLVDSGRQVPLYASHSKLFKVSQVSQTFQIKLDAINDANIQVALSIRDEKDEILAFPSENELPSFILRRQDYPNPKRRSTYAVLFSRGEWH